MSTALILLGLLFIACAVVTLLYSLGVFGQSSKLVRDRLADTTASAGVIDAGPMLSADKRTGRFVRMFTSATAISAIERNIMLAGRPDGWTLRRIMILKPVLTLAAVLFLFLMLSRSSSPLAWLVGVVGIFAGYFAPDIILNRRAEMRQEVIQQQLPDVLDQVTISIEAGLGFEAAFSRIGERRSGPLADEIVRTVQDMRVGMSRREAYQALADRTNVDDLRIFVKAIIQAEQYGVSVASVVRTQASEMRFKRRTRAEARALKVPVKILFPLLVCILPVLFIVVLTPAFISLSTTVADR
jgi:tight adherence protein C